MNPVDRRLIEVVGIALQRPLTDIEVRDLRECHAYIINREWRLARVMNLMWMARKTRDWKWFEQLTKEYCRVMRMY
jgi:hypothetical protein